MLQNNSTQTSWRSCGRSPKPGANDPASREPVTDSTWRKDADFRALELLLHSWVLQEAKGKRSHNLKKRLRGMCSTGVRVSGWSVAPVTLVDWSAMPYFLEFMIYRIYDGYVGFACFVVFQVRVAPFAPDLKFLCLYLVSPYTNFSG